MKKRWWLRGVIAFILIMGRVCGWAAADSGFMAIDGGWVEQHGLEGFGHGGERASRGALAEADTILSYSLDINERYTTNLIFAAPILHADLGGGGVTAKKWSGLDNVLLVKAARAGMRETNLSVYLADGVLYSFTVRYDVNARGMNLRFRRRSAEDALEGAALPGPSKRTVSREKLALATIGEAGTMAGRQALLPSDMAADARGVQRSTGFMRHYVRNGKLWLGLRKIYIRHQLMWLGLEGTNLSPIDFESGSMHFYLRDKRRRLRRRASQTLAIEPVFERHTVCAAGVVVAGSRDSMAIAFKPFYIPRGKFLEIEWREKDGGRILRLVVRGRLFLRAKIWRSGNGTADDEDDRDEAAGGQ